MSDIIKHLVHTSKIEGKKLTISYFLNRKLKPSIKEISDSKIVKVFPLYVELIYNREMTKFKYLGNIDFFESEEDLRIFIGSKEERSDLEKLLSYFKMDNDLFAKKTPLFDFSTVITQQNPYTLKGFANRCENYQKSVYAFFEQKAIEATKSSLKAFLPYDKYITITSNNKLQTYEDALHVLDELEKNNELDIKSLDNFVLLGAAPNREFMQILRNNKEVLNNISVLSFLRPNRFGVTLPENKEAHKVISLYYGQNSELTGDFEEPIFIKICTSLFSSLAISSMFDLLVDILKKSKKK